MRMRRAPAVAGLAVLLAAAAGSAGYRAAGARSLRPRRPPSRRHTATRLARPPGRSSTGIASAATTSAPKTEGRPAFDEVDLGDSRRRTRPCSRRSCGSCAAGRCRPTGSRRPDQATLDAFVTALETALDREGARQPDPGRVASRRLNRVEYVNAIQDLLGLEIDGTALLPSDMAGFGFDNNADVLSITPALMSRYAAAATKISRAAIGSPDNRPVQQVYSLGFEQQDARMGEEMPFATHGGMAVRHLFPLDGEYVFAIRMKGSEGGGGGITGIEDEHEIELRLDHALVKRFTIGGKFKGPDPGTLISVPEDDIEGQQIHEYRLNADKALEIRVPVKAGTRLVAVAFSDSTPSPLDGAYGRPGIDKVMVSGPFNGSVPTETPSRQRIFVCRPASSRDEEPCARQILTCADAAGVPAAGRPIATSSRCWPSTVRDAGTATSTRASSERSRRCCRCLNSCSASNGSRPASDRAAPIA